MPETLLVRPTVTVQLAAAGMVRPLNWSVPVCPAVKLLEPAPAQVPPAGPVAATERFVSASVKKPPVSATALGFEMVKVTTLVPPCWMGLTEKAFEMVGAPTTIRFVTPETAPVGACALETPLVEFA